MEDDAHNQHNLGLTYAVRDGIISHCGEVNQRLITPRQEAIDLNTYHKPGAYDPYTYEACVVKMSDKIAYLGRDIEDHVA
ncbi:MAG: deoxyguanosinetriphosphate triphosphohydrolase family protein, partial [bacterium]